MYAEARYYMAAFGRWGGVDPLADKYPNYGPYVYAASNPILILDPDGRDIKIYYDCDDEGENCSEWVFTGDNAEEGRELENEFVNQFLDAYSYVVDNVENTSLQEAAESDEFTIDLRKGTLDNSGSRGHYFERNRTPERSRTKGTVYWDPVKGSKYDTGLTAPPALGLGHEFAHAVGYANDPRGYIQRGDKVPRYGSEEERRVIKGEEQRIARGLGLIGPGQVTRTNHEGDVVIVNGPTSTSVNRKATFHYYQRLDALGYNVESELRRYGQ